MTRAPVAQIVMCLVGILCLVPYVKEHFRAYRRDR